MSDIVTFVLNLKETLSSGIQKAGITTRSVFGGIDRTISNTQKGLNDLSKPVKLNVDASGVRDAFGKLRDEKGRFMAEFGGLSSWSVAKGSFVGSMAARGVEMGMRGIREIGSQALNAGMDAEQQIIGLSTFIGKDKAKGLYSQLQKESALTPFTTSDMLPTMMQLIASGQTPEKAKKDMWALMNALSATGNAGNPFMMSLMGTHLSSAAAQGFMDGRILMEFQRTAHIPINRLLANDLFPKLPVREGMKRVDQIDKVSYDQLSHALQRASEAGGMFAGALEAQSQTIKGKWSTIRDFWNIGMAKATLDPKTHDNIIRLEDRLISGLQGFPEMIGKISPYVNKVFDSFDNLLPSIKGFATTVGTLVKPLGSLVLSNEFRDLARNAIDLASSLGTALKPIVKDVADTFRDLLPAITGLTHGVTGIVDGLGKGIDILNQIITGHTRWGEGNTPGYLSVHGAHGMSAGFAVATSTGIQYMNPLGAPTVGKKALAEWNSMGIDGLLAKGKKDSSGSMADTSDAIVGGGRKVVNITFRNFTEHFTIQASSMKDAVDKSETWFKEMWLRVIRTVPS